MFKESEQVEHVVRMYGSSGEPTADGKIYPHPHQPHDQTFWEYDRYNHMSLQDAFRTHRYDVILNSRQRVRDLKAKETRRQLARELLLRGGDERQEVELYRSMAERLEHESRRHLIDRQRALAEKNRRFAYFNELATPTAAAASAAANRRQAQSGVPMSKREIKERTRRKYEKLPEVQQKLLREKLEENKAKNRIKSNIFKKVNNFFSFFCVINLNNLVKCTFKM